MQFEIVIVVRPPEEQWKRFVRVVVHVRSAGCEAIGEIVGEVERDLLRGVHDIVTGTRVSRRPAGEKRRDSKSGRVDAVGRNDIAGKRIADELTGIVRIETRRQGIVNRTVELREGSSSHGRRW